MTFFEIVPKWIGIPLIILVCLIPIAICAGIITLFVLAIKALRKYLREK